MLVVSHQKRWDTGAKLFRKFVARHGHPNVPSKFVVGDMRLGSWLGVQRQAYRHGSLTAERLDVLYGIHPEWFKGFSAVERWDTNAKLYRTFVAEHGHPNVPQKSSVDGVRLGIWLDTQRRAYRRSDLAPELSAAMFDIHPKWLNSIGRAAQWEASAKLFRKFVAEYGHPNVPSRLTVDGVRLGSWLSVQRQAYRHGSLTAERLNVLHGIHSRWDNTDADIVQWKTNAKLLRRFVTWHGHPNVPGKFTMCSVALGTWLSNQRRAHRRGRLAAERVAALNKIHPKWHKGGGRAAQRDASAKLFREFVAERGHPRVPQKFTVDGVRLGIWLNTQRYAYRHGRLTPKRAAALFDIHPNWSSHKPQ